MLVGMLCEVVNAVTAGEKERILIDCARDKLLRVFDKMGGSDWHKTISRDEFEMMREHAGCLEAFHFLEIEPKHLFALADSLFEDDGLDSLANSAETFRSHPGKELSFDEFLDVVCHMRPGNCATCLDVTDFRRNVALTTKKVEELAADATQRLQQELAAHVQDADDFDEPGTLKRLSVLELSGMLDARLDGVNKKCEALEERLLDARCGMSR